MQRKIDQIRALENQRDHEHERALKAEAKLAELRAGSDEFLRIFNAVLMGACLKYGERRDEDGEYLGHRLAVPKVDVNEMNDRYDVRVTLNDGEFVIGMIEREQTK